eukprot:694739-Prymnesium_polylepis.1
MYGGRGPAEAGLSMRADGSLTASCGLRLTTTRWALMRAMLMCASTTALSRSSTAQRRRSDGD